MAVFNLGPLGLPIEMVAPTFSFQPEGKNNWIPITEDDSTTDYNTVWAEGSTIYFAYKKQKNTKNQVVWELALFKNGKLKVETPRDKDCYIFMVGKGGSGWSGTGNAGANSGVEGGKGGGGGYQFNNNGSNITLQANTTYDFTLTSANDANRPKFGDYLCSGDTYSKGGSGASFETYNGQYVTNQIFPTSGTAGTPAYGNSSIKTILFKSTDRFGAGGSGGGAVIDCSDHYPYTHVTKGNTTSAETGGGTGGTTDRTDPNNIDNILGGDGFFYGAGGGGSFRDCGNGANQVVTGAGKGAHGILLLRSVENPD